MSDREYEEILRQREFDEFIRYFEQNIAGRPLTEDEREEFNKRYQPLCRMKLDPDAEPGLRRMVWLDLIEQLKSRQGSVLPDFEELYRRKSQLDGET